MCNCPIRLRLLRLYECPGEAKICNLQLREIQGLAKWTSAAHTRAALCAALCAALYAVASSLAQARSVISP